MGSAVQLPPISGAGNFIYTGTPIRAHIITQAHLGCNHLEPGCTWTPFTSHAHHHHGNHNQGNTIVGSHSRGRTGSNAPSPAFVAHHQASARGKPTIHLNLECRVRQRKDWAAAQVFLRHGSGDMNFLSEQDAFNSLLTVQILANDVSFPTHKKVGSLDPVLTDLHDSSILCHQHGMMDTSDHHAVLTRVKLNMARKATPHETGRSVIEVQVTSGRVERLMREVEENKATGLDDITLPPQTLR
ncbi:hypothetical protein E2C01_034780 [Portunus trituberculatus]|uniref:Uncharacterized protein n=1 Tax=Portunus trituberculatus TaxID=210409 RepID=A0A5B7F7X7_PORTR|nr:hypothetical protein [Portunus trituberculatus]